MLQFINNRSLKLGERVECYFNSKKNLISVRSIDIRNDNYMKIVAYAEYLHLEDASFTYCTSNDRKIYKRTYAGGLPVFPSNEHLVLHDETGFHTTSGNEIVGACFAVCYLSMLLAEQPVLKGAQWNESIYRE